MNQLYFNKIILKDEKIRFPAALQNRKVWQHGASFAWSGAEVPVGGNRHLSLQFPCRQVRPHPSLPSPSTEAKHQRPRLSWPHFTWTVLAFHRATFIPYQYLSAPETLKCASADYTHRASGPLPRGPLWTLEPELAFHHLLPLTHNPVETGKARSPWSIPGPALGLSACPSSWWQAFTLVITCSPGVSGAPPPHT